MKMRIEIDELDMKRLIVQHIVSVLGDYPFKREALTIEVKSKQNYKSEWKNASFRATYEEN